jgi:hypothetical protein
MLSASIGLKRESIAPFLLLQNYCLSVALKQSQVFTATDTLRVLTDALLHLGANGF